MKKVIFSRTELHKFLLLGDCGNYIVDKINPSIRAIKRKEMLAVFCTLRIRKRTTSVKLGEFPENNLEEIYAKFKIARNISSNGNNPNFYLKQVKDVIEKEEFDSIESFSIEDLIKIFLNHKQYSQKYRYDFTNCLKKNFGKKFHQPLKKLSRQDFKNRAESLHRDSKFGALKNFIYKTNILFLYFLKNDKFKDLHILKDILSIIPNIRLRYLKIKNEETKQNDVSKLIKILKNLDKKQLSKVENFMKKINT